MRQHVEFREIAQCMAEKISLAYALTTLFSPGAAGVDLCRPFPYAPRRRFFGPSAPLRSPAPALAGSTPYPPITTRLAQKPLQTNVSQWYRTQYLVCSLCLFVKDRRSNRGGRHRSGTHTEGACLSASNPSLLRVEDDRPMRSCSSLTRIRTFTVVRTLASFSETMHAIASIAQTPAARSSPKRFCTHFGRGEANNAAKHQEHKVLFRAKPTMAHAAPVFAACSRCALVFLLGDRPTCLLLALAELPTHLSADFCWLHRYNCS